MVSFMSRCSTRSYRVELPLCPLRSLAVTGLSLTSAQGRSPRGDYILPRAPRAPSPALPRSCSSRIVVDFFYSDVLFYRCQRRLRGRYPLTGMRLSSARVRVSIDSLLLFSINTTTQASRHSPHCNAEHQFFCSSSFALLLTSSHPGS